MKKGECGEGDRHLDGKKLIATRAPLVSAPPLPRTPLHPSPPPPPPTVTHLPSCCSFSRVFFSPHPFFFILPIEIESSFVKGRKVEV